MLTAFFVFKTLKIFVFCPNFFDYAKKLDKEANVNFKIYDVTGWTCPIFVNEIWSINKI